jgi:signal transduction histidine kinase
VRKIKLTRKNIFSIVLITDLILFVLIVQVFFHQLKFLEQKYIIENQRSVEIVRLKISERISDVYDMLRLISRQPEVMELNKTNKTLSVAVKKGIQEVYNTIYSKFKVSEVYFVDKDFNPNLINSITGKKEEPLISFDEFIVGKIHESNKQFIESEKNKIPEVEEFEYLQIVNQIDNFKKLFTKNSNNLWEVPLQISESVISCDNSLYSISKPNDEDRSGVVLSVPYFNSKGEFSGVVSAIVLNHVFQEMLSSTQMILRREFSTKLLFSLLGNPTESPAKWMDVPNMHIFEHHSEIPILNLLGERIYLDSFEEDLKFYLSSECYYLYLATLFALFFIILVSLFIIRFVIDQINKEVDLKRRQQELQFEIEKQTKIIREQQESSNKNEKLASLGIMAGGIVHEINNPLAVIDGVQRRIRRLLKDKGIAINEIDENLDKISKYLDRIIKIIKGLKHLSRDASQDPFKLSSAKAIIDEAILFVDEKMRSKGVQFEFKISEDFQISCRDVQISQIIINLIGNSIDAIQNTKSPWIHLELSRKANECHFRITDSGKTPDEDIIYKLFTPFFTTKSIGQGTGLGLSISHTIAKSHNGDLYIDINAVNTTFCLVLPISQDTPIS